MDRELSTQDTIFAVKDLIEGDEAVASLFTDVDDGLLNQAVEILISDPHLSDRQRINLLANSWRVSFRVKPPTVQEFLTEEWLGPSANDLFPHIKRDLEAYLDPTSPYRHLVLAPAIGYGKSTEATLACLYKEIYLWSMRNPKKYFPGIMEATPIAWMLMSFTEEKAQQVLMQPFTRILLTSPKFHRVKFEEKLDDKQREFPDKVCWTTAGRMGSLQFYNDLHIVVASSPQKLLGLTMVGATLSEISFFVDQGFSTDYIWRTFQDAKWRVRSRFADKKIAGTILDSSPNDIDLSPIDRYIFSGEASKDPANYVVTGAQWEYLPEKYPEWLATQQTFPVFRGSAKEPPKILRTEDEILAHPRDEVYNVPIDLKRAFEENCPKNVKDYCGWPAGSQDKLFSDPSVIESMFTPALKNIYSYIEAPANQPAEGLIWNTIGPKLFIKVGERRWEFYRAPHVPRFIHIDQSESGDFTAISMVHAETWIKVDELGHRIPLTIIVADFTLAIRPGKHRVNLLAVPYFILDLVKKGGINLSKVTFDRYESAIGIQMLKDAGLEVARQSVDFPIGAYLSLATHINSNRMRVGYNIVLRNNLRSLHETTTPAGNRKIDHILGSLVTEDSGDWEHSQIGINAKDVADSLCGATASCLANFHDHASFIWEEPSEASSTPGIEQSASSYSNAIMDTLKRSLKEKYNLILSG